MIVTLPKDNKYNVSETVVVWDRANNSISYSRMISSTIAHFRMKCDDAEQFVTRLDKARKMNDDDFYYIHELNKGE